MAEIKSINGYKLNDTIARENIVNLTNDLNNKVDKVNNKGLSTNDYTSLDKGKVNMISTDGDGSKFLANDGTYKTIDTNNNGSSTTIIMSDNTDRYFLNVSSFEFLNMISPGINLGNTFDSHRNENHPDAPNTVIGWETLWNNVETTKEVFEAYKTKGFRSVRICVTWFEHMDSKGVIDSAWFERIKQVLDWALESGLFVILNAHHDTNSGKYVSAVPSEYETSKAHLINIWSQVGTYFANYDHRLIFESMNECLNHEISDIWHGNEESFAIINKLNQDFVKCIRRQSGNENRFLIVPTYAAKANADTGAAFIMPTDYIAKDRLIVEVHRYDTTEDDIRETIGYVERHLGGKNLPIYLGEYGIRPSEVSNEAERARLIGLQTKLFRQLGAGVCIWDNGNGSYKQLNRKTFNWYYPEVIDAVINNTYKIGKIEYPLLDETYDITYIGNWKEGRLGNSDAEYTPSDKNYFSSMLYVVPKYSSYTITMSSSNDRLIVFQLNENRLLIENGRQTLVNGSKLEILPETRYVSFCYYQKNSSTGGTATKSMSEFQNYIENGNISIVKTNTSIKNFPILDSTIENALIALSRNTNTGSTTDPGTTGPGTTDPSTTDPGTTDPGTTDPGNSDPNATIRTNISVTALSAPPGQTQFFEDEDATTFINRLTPAINLGNSLDSWDSNSHPTRTAIDWEKSWNNCETTKEILQKYKDAGFVALRLPITWFVHLDENGNIKQDWFERVKQIIDWCYELEMPVIINVHHDTNEGNYINANVDKLELSKAHLINLWNQIGPCFANYDNRLIFECMNECLNLDLGSSAKWKGNSDGYTCINTLNQAFVNTIRNQKGNENRFLLVPTYAAQAFSGTIGGFVLPTDTVENRLIAEVHNYGYTKSDMDNVTFKYIKRYLTDKGIPVLMGEFGIKPSKIADETERANMIAYFCQSARKLGVALCVWDRGHGTNDYELLDRNTKNGHEPTLEWFYPQVIRAIIDNGK